MNAILENLISPLVRRIGTAVAVWLLAQGAESQLVEQAINGLSAAVLVGVDLFLARIYRSNVETKTALRMTGGDYREALRRKEGD